MSRKSPGAATQGIKCWRLRHRGLLLLKADWQGNTVYSQRGESTEAPLEVYRGFKESFGSLCVDELRERIKGRDQIGKGMARTRAPVFTGLPVDRDLHPHIPVYTCV